MVFLQVILFLTLFEVANSQIQFITPQAYEIIPSNSEYEITWVAEASGQGTITLFGGQSADSFNKLWDIAYYIDVAGGTFSWPVGRPTLGTQLLAFYGLKFSLDGSDGEFSTSSLFRIKDGNDQSATPSSSPSDNEPSSSTRRTNPATSNVSPVEGTSETNLPTSIAIPVGNTTPTTPTSSSAIPAESTSETTHATNDASPVGNTSEANSTQSSISPVESTSNLPVLPVPTATDSRISIPTGSSQTLNSTRRIDNGALAGIVIGSVAALGIFSSLLGFVMHYRRRYLRERGLLKNRASEIDGRYKKAELETRRCGIKVTRVYELDTAREPQEADGVMKPAELDAAAWRSVSVKEQEWNDIQ
ncbi:hypothetical protein F4777DRAFT_375076 [Nemania sp. FL0916]|nr:hypothetical protein F4777DRAFT_375076 [Nemania sp. FL0916]